MYELKPADIRHEWSRIRPALEQVHEEQRTDWIPEDIYHVVMSGRGRLWLSDDGFAVTQEGTNAFSGAPYLFVWVCYSWMDGSGFAKRYKGFMDRLARSGGFSYVETCSLSTAHTRLGFETNRIVYRKAV